MISELIHKIAGPFSPLLAVQLGQLVIRLANLPVEVIEALFQLPRLFLPGLLRFLEPRLHLWDRLLQLSAPLSQFQSLALEPLSDLLFLLLCRL